METTRTILIVDDTPMFLEVESLFLARSGRVLTAASADEALAMARREKPDLMVVDHFMPGTDGIELCRIVKQDPELGETRVVIVSSSAEAQDRALALRAGADDVLSKPVSRVVLIESVRRFIRYATVRGLPRVPFRTPVRVDAGGTDWVGRARNLSRGGIYVEGGKELALHSEVTLEFDLPDERRAIRPTAEVVWMENDDDGDVVGMGLRFLGIDGGSTRRIQEWVYERTNLPGARRSLGGLVA